MYDTSTCKTYMYRHMNVLNYMYCTCVCGERERERERRDEGRVGGREREKRKYMYMYTHLFLQNFRGVYERGGVIPLSVHCLLYSIGQSIEIEYFQDYRRGAIIRNNIDRSTCIIANKMV